MQKVEVGCSKHSLQSRKFVYNDCGTAAKNISTAKSDGNAGVYPNYIRNCRDELYEYLLLNV